jgi:hypothetical protein
MKPHIECITVNLSAYPDLVVIYLDAKTPLGFGQFAPVQVARGSMFSVRRRMQWHDETNLVAPIPEEESYEPKTS